MSGRFHNVNRNILNNQSSYFHLRIDVLIKTLMLILLSNIFINLFITEFISLLVLTIVRQIFLNGIVG